MGFSTGGEKSSFPLNQGFTVCWSDDDTSTGWCGSIRDRTWLEITSCAMRSSEEGPFGRCTNVKVAIATMATEAATASQRHDANGRRLSILTSARNADVIF